MSFGTFLLLPLLRAGYPDIICPSGHLPPPRHLPPSPPPPTFAPPGHMPLRHSPHDIICPPPPRKLLNNG